MDSQGRFLSAGQTGEIVIRGANVFQGYENNDRESAQTFTASARIRLFSSGDQEMGWMFLAFASDTTFISSRVSRWITSQDQ